MHFAATSPSPATITPGGLYQLGLAALTGKGQKPAGSRPEPDRRVMEMK